MIRERMAIQRKRAQEREAEQARRHEVVKDDTGPAGLELMPDTPSKPDKPKRAKRKQKA